MFQSRPWMAGFPWLSQVTDGGGVVRGRRGSSTTEGGRAVIRVVLLAFGDEGPQRLSGLRVTSQHEGIICRQSCAVGE